MGFYKLLYREVLFDNIGWSKEEGKCTIFVSDTKS